MSKPLFLICPGLPKSGTTLLWAILQKYNSYIHCGVEKETCYLCLAHLRRNGLPYFWMQDYFNQVLQNKLRYPKPINTLQDKLDEKIYSKFASEKYSLSTYAKYYLNLHEIVNSIYYGVGDFSAVYADHNFTDEYLQEIDDYLSNFFTVKIVILFRDPVKRLFSFCHMEKITYNLPSAVEYFNSSICNPKVQNLYPNVYDKFFTVFGDRVLLLNEKFFDPNDVTQRVQLEQFLNIPTINIENIFPSGDTKTDAWKKLQANTQTYTEMLSEYDIERSTELLKPSYDFYNSTFYT